MFPTFPRENERGIITLPNAMCYGVPYCLQACPQVRGVNNLGLVHLFMSHHCAPLTDRIAYKDVNLGKNALYNDYEVFLVSKV